MSLRPKRQKRCRAEGCGRMFTPSTSFDKGCSPKCRRVIERDKPPKKEKPPLSPRRTPSYRQARKIDLNLEGRMRAFKRGDPSRRCSMCAHGKPQAHHVTYRQHVRVAHGDEWDARNALNVCKRCHDRHHGAESFKITLRSLRDDNIEFCVELYGADSAFMYLTRIYVGSDPRVEALRSD